MARAMIAGLLQNGYPTNNIWAGSPKIEKYTPLKNDFEIHITTNNIEAAQKADVIVFAVKPRVAKTICEEFINLNTVSIILRMPIIASAVGAGVTALFATSKVDEEQKTFAESLFRSIGTTVWLSDENQLDVITAVSGSGPA